MRTKPGAALMSMVLAIVAMAFWVPPATAGDGDASRVAPPGSHAYGKTLGEWLGIYWRWFYTGADPAQSTVRGVKLLALPTGDDVTQVGGTGTADDPALLRGKIEIVLRPGTPFVLPLAAWTLERYNNGTPDDLAIPDAEFLEGVSPLLTIDGRVVVSNVNKRAFYVPPTAFNPIVIYPQPSSYHSYAAIAYQGYGIVSPPLSVGTHVIKLHEPYIIRSLSFGVVYDNTWTVTVKPH